MRVAIQIKKGRDELRGQERKARKMSSVLIRLDRLRGSAWGQCWAVCVGYREWQESKKKKNQRKPSKRLSQIARVNR